jgi:hypothetical protein
MAGRLAMFLAGVALALAPGADAATFHATLSASTHTPKASAKWWYTVRARDLAGHPIRAALTVQIADPFGGVHPVAYDDTKKNIVRRPFDGTFRDYVQFPADSRGFKLTVRITVWAKGSKVVLSYWIKAR